LTLRHQTTPTVPGLNPWFILGAVLAVLAIGGGSYVKGRNDGKHLEQAEQLTQAAIREETREMAIQAAAEQIAKISIVNKTIYARATREVIEKPVYRECLHTDDGLHAVNDALANRQTEPAGAGKLPGTDTAR
jgi:hypothetical protein